MMQVELTEKDMRIIMQAMKVWVGDFPDTNCIPSSLWQEELKELIEKFSFFIEEYKGL